MNHAQINGIEPTHVTRARRIRILFARRAMLRVAVATAAGLVTASALAQSFPGKPVRIISTYPPGITPDIATRLVADKLTKYWNQQVIVEPRPGGNGFIAISALKQAAPDGYTLLLVGNAHLAINPHLFKSVPYDPVADFSPVSTLYRAPFFVGVATPGPYKTVGDIVKAAAEHPNKVAYSTPYVGSPPHFCGAVLESLTNTTMMPVHYKDGAQIYIAVANGDVAFSVATIRSFAPMVDAGKMKVIAVAAPDRLPGYPDIPTVEESGGPKGMNITTWIGFVAPRGTPPEVVDRINADVSRALNEPDVQQRLKEDGVAPLSLKPAAMTDLIRTENGVYKKAVKDFGLRAE